MVKIAAAGLALLAVALFVAAARAERRERERRRAAWRAYFQGGGLIRSLMARWARTPRLTDQRGISDEEEVVDALGLEPRTR
jgi:hypothetical protein